MLVCSMALSVYVPTRVHREPVMLASALMAVLETARSKCVVGLDTLTYSTPMLTKQQLMTLAAATPCRIPTTKSGIKTWAIVVNHFKNVYISVYILHLPYTLYPTGGNGGSGSGGKFLGTILVPIVNMHKPAHFQSSFYTLFQA